MVKPEGPYPGYGLIKQIVRSLSFTKLNFPRQINIQGKKINRSSLIKIKDSQRPGKFLAGGNGREKKKNIDCVFSPLGFIGINGACKKNYKTNKKREIDREKNLAENYIIRPRKLILS